jgi:hypothetical protein
VILEWIFVKSDAIDVNRVVSVIDLAGLSDQAVSDHGDAQ